MCGILGVIDQSEILAADEFEPMLATLADRGPDGHGTEYLQNGHVALGHTRLSIIDTSDAGRQPMSNENDEVWTVFNGEIYNFAEIRRELKGLGHYFKSQSDTEIIVHGYEEWGPKCIERFNGIFALAVWDGKKRSLLLARDRLGVKPLYYAIQSGRLWFASLPRAIAADEQFVRNVDRESFQQFLTFGFVPGDRAIFSDMRKLPPAHTAVFSAGSCKIRRYWAPPLETTIFTKAEAVDRVQEQLSQSVASQLVSDVPVATFLSGGLDSSIVTSLAKAANVGPLDAFTIGFQEAERDERPYARLAASHIGVRLHEAVMHYNEAALLFDEVVAAYDEPFSGTSSLPTYLVCQQARRNGLKVVLGGDGGDELFAGYTRYDAQQRYAKRGMKRRLKDLVKRRALRRKLPGSAFEQLLSFYCRIPFEDQQTLLNGASRGLSFSDICRPMRKVYRDDLPPLTASRLADLQFYLPDHVLCKVDRASMAHGVEVRVPILDHELVELAFQIDDAVIYGDGGKKEVLRSAASKWLPDELTAERKQGFNIPASRWDLTAFCKDGADFLLDGSLCGRGILSSDGIRRSGMPGSRAWWQLFVAEQWARRWLEAKPKTAVSIGCAG